MLFQVLKSKNTLKVAIDGAAAFTGRCQLNAPRPAAAWHWGSYPGWEEGRSGPASPPGGVRYFRVCIYSDRPAIGDNMSRPDCLLYEALVPAANFTETYVTSIFHPVECPKCHAEMKIISFISKSQPEVIRKILEHLELWEEKIRPPPNLPPEETPANEPF